MPSPIAQFGYIINDLEVTFTSLSLNVEVGTTYLWDFGDGNTSTLENPVHTFLTTSYFIVSLTVTNPDTSDSLINETINLSGNISPALFNNIPKLVDLYSPTSVIGSIKNHDQKEFLIAKWQLYLQPLMVEPEISVINTHNESVWSALANSLIAKLVVIDIITMESSAFLMGAAVNGQSLGTSSSSSEDNVSSNGGIKSIETGPTKIERYENKDASSSSEATSNLSKSYQNLVAHGGVLDQLKMTACQEAQRIRVYLPMCGQLPWKPRALSVTKKCKGGYNANPFGITDRMT